MQRIATSQILWVSVAFLYFFHLSLRGLFACKRGTFSQFHGVLMAEKRPCVAWVDGGGEGCTGVFLLVLYQSSDAVKVCIR